MAHSSRPVKVPHSLFMPTSYKAICWMTCKFACFDLQIRLQITNKLRDTYMTPQEALQKAIDIVGSQARLAREIGGGIKQAHISYWITHAEVVPAEHCPTI